VVHAEMPDSWVEQLSVTGSVDDAKARFQRYFDAGADRVVVVPIVAENADESIAAARELLSTT
jgi:2-methylisocitrate lyase-like PEP mutase family enzyme